MEMRVWSKLGPISLIIVVLALGSHMPTAWVGKKLGRGGSCLLFHLKIDMGEIINPITGQNADQSLYTFPTPNFVFRRI